MKFGHYWPKDPASEQIRHLRRHVERYPMIYGTMPVLRFEPFDVGPREKTRDELASDVHKTLFGEELRYAGHTRINQR